MAADQDTLKHLEAVRKGKPRSFVMVCKGVKILNLVVFQKGSLAGKIKEAKEQGSGKVFAGTVVGNGQDIRFQLKQTDYDSTPGKDLTLKEYLADEVEFKCQPSYQLVAELTPVPEVDAPDSPASPGSSTTPGSVPSPTAPTSSPTPIPVPVAPVPGGPAPVGPVTVAVSAEVEQLLATMNKLVASIQQAVAAHPDRREEFLKPVAEFRAHLKENRTGDAKAALLRVAQLLKSLASDAANAPGGVSPPIQQQTAPVQTAPVQTAPVQTGSVQPVAAAPSSDDPQAAVYVECREIYAKARLKVRANLERLENVILEVCKLEDGYDPGEAAERAAAIYQVLDVLDERLLKVLDQAAANPAQREQLNDEALDLIDGYLNYAASDPFVTALESNGFVAVGVRRNMVDALSDLSRKL